MLFMDSIQILDDVHLRCAAECAKNWKFESVMDKNSEDKFVKVRR